LNLGNNNFDIQVKNRKY